MGSQMSSYVRHFYFPTLFFLFYFGSLSTSHNNRNLSQSLFHNESIGMGPLVLVRDAHRVPQLSRFTDLR